MRLFLYIFYFFFFMLGIRITYIDFGRSKWKREEPFSGIFKCAILRGHPVRGCRVKEITAEVTILPGH